MALPRFENALLILFRDSLLRDFQTFNPSKSLLGLAFSGHDAISESLGTSLKTALYNSL